LPSTFFIERLTEFLSTEKRKNWVGLDAGCGPHLGVLAKYGLDAEPFKSFVNPDYPIEYFTWGNIYDMPFEDNRFDYVVSAHVIEHLEKPIEAIIQMTRVAKYVVIANVPRYTLDPSKVTDCVKIDHYYLSDHPELLKDLGLTKKDLIWAPRATCFGHFEAPHCGWYPNPEDLIELFKKTNCFSEIKAEVCPNNCGESNIFGWLK